jgi:O-antigen ligase
MAYVLCLIYIAVTYIRPAELNPALIPYRIGEITGISATVAAVISLMVRPRAVLNLPTDWCFLGFIGAAFLANPMGASVDQLNQASSILFPLAAFWVLIRLTVETPRQLKVLVIAVSLLATLQGVGVVTWRPAAGVDADVPSGVHSEEPAEAGPAERFYGSGMYGDPNDLALSMLLVVPFLLSAVLTKGSGLVFRAGGAAALGIIAYAIQITQSRGGFVGLAALVGAYSYRRFGRMSAVAVLALVIAAGIALGPSRLQQIDSREASAQGRVQAWGAGLQMVKSNPLMGVGLDRFGSLHGRVAHNAFVHTFAELGFLGGLMLVGMFYWHFVLNGVSRNVSGAATSPLARDLWASGIGVVTAASFLSVQYVPILYVALVIGAARVTVEREPGADPSVARGSDWGWLVAVALLVIAAVYLVVRLFTFWG